MFVSPYVGTQVIIIISFTTLNSARFVNIIDSEGLRSRNAWNFVSKFFSAHIEFHEFICDKRKPTWQKGIWKQPFKEKIERF